MPSVFRAVLRLLRPSSLCLCVLAFCGLASPCCAAAATYLVSPTGSDSGLGTPSAPFLTIQHGINAAVSGDTVLVEEGTYTGPGNVDLDFGGRNITVRSQNGASSTMIDCQGSSSTNHRGFYLHSGEMGAIIDGFTVENGYEGGSGSSADAANGGAGIFNLNAGITIEYCVFKSNTALYGGGLYNHNIDTGAATIINCTFSGNSAAYGGAVYDYNESGGKINVTGGMFTNNLASTSGGGFYNIDDTGGTLTLSGCMISGNMSLGNSLNGISDGGGGIYSNEFGGTTRVTNCVLTGNSAAYYGFGGGLYNGTHGGTILVTSCTLTGNKSASGSGGGVYDSLYSGTLTLTDDIVYGDTGGDVAGSLVTASYCDIQGGYTGTSNINAAPVFSSAPTDLRLILGSPCLGAGTASGAPARTIDGRARPAPPSIGAYEVATSATATTTTLTSTSNPSVAGQFVLFQANIAGTGTSTTGTVTFSIDGVAHPAVPVKSGRFATYLTSALTVGTHTITATYSGDLDYSPSTSSALAQTVNPHISPLYVSPTGNDSNPGTQAAPKLTIQAAMNTTLSGDTVIVEDGTYTGPGNVDIDFGGNNLTVTSQNGPAATIIDCQGIANHRGFYLHFGETGAVIRGLTIQNGHDSSGGAGIYNSNATLTVQNCVLKNNIADGTNGGGIYNGGILAMTSCTLIGNAAVTNGSTSAGGGIYNDSGTLTVMNCVFSGNSAGEGGGGLYNGTAYNGASGVGLLTLVNCVFAGNSVSDGSGGGLYNAAYYGANTVTNCTFTGNSASYSYGGGILSYIGGGGGSTFSLINDIVYGDSNGEVSGNFSTISYCNVQGGYAGTGNINADPLFVNSPTDLHLQPGSPCIGAGTASGAPTTDITGMTRPNPPSIGAYEAAPLTPPTSLTATAGTGQVSLKWTAPSGVSGATYSLFRSTATGAETVYQTGLTAASYTDTAVTPGVKYFYIVKTVVGSQSSAASNEASATPTAPVLGKVRYYPAIGQESRMVGGKFQGSHDNSAWTTLYTVTAKPADTWTEGSVTVADPKTFRFLRYLSPNGGYGNVAEIEFYTGSGTNAVKLTGRPFGTPGSYNNRGNVYTNALDGSTATFFSAPSPGNGDFVGIDQFPPTTAPTGLSATGGSKITLTWTASAGATNYTLSRGTAAGGEAVYQSGLTGTSYTDTGAVAGVTYFYTLAAVNPSGTSAASNEASAVTGRLSGSGSALTASRSINLTTLGTADWAHWGLSRAANFDHKAASGTTPVGLISNYAIVGTGTVTTYSSSLANCTWTGGTPTASATSAAEVYIAGDGSGFSLTIPADSTRRTLTLYVGGYDDNAKLTAHLSDGSAADYVDSSYGYNKPGNTDGAHFQAVYTLTYSAASAGQALTVSWVQTSSVTATNHVTLEAAALAAAP